MSFEIAQRIRNVTHSGICTGCGTCVGVCPEKTLEMEMTPEGIYIPKLVDNDCTECLLCMDVCPAGNENLKELNQFIFGKMPDNIFMGNFTNCYKGYSTDSAIRWSATSGGLITSLLIFLLENGSIDGALLTRANRDSPLIVESFVARTKPDILLAIGSKYVPVPVNQLFNQILSEEGRFAVVGLPCHIQGIRRAELSIAELRDKIVYHFGLTCSRTVNLDGVKHVLRKMGVPPNEVAELRYRGEGWPSGIRVLSTSGERKLLSNQDSWWSEIFGGYFFVPYCCTLCYDHLNEFADISFADAWLPDIKQTDTVGTSIAVTRTHIGDELIKAATTRNEIESFPLGAEDVIRSQLWPLFFKKRNIKVRVRLLSLLGRSIPKNLKENMDAFLNPTLWDYVAAPIPYIDNFISKNAILKRILEHIPLGLLARYRQRFRQWLLHNAAQSIEGMRRDEGMARNTIKILITNSHSNNRGDEAAQRSLIDSLEALVPNIRFTVLTASPQGLQLQEHVRLLQFFHIPKKYLLPVVSWTFFRSFGVRLPTFNKGAEVVEALEEMAQADVVISAPGGPYFGELYVNHEVQHLLHILLPKVLRKPVMIYAPSMGPFESPMRNIIRKRILNRVEIITLRDPISKEYLGKLNLGRPLVYLTADSAFQRILNLDKEQIETILTREKIIEAENRKPLVGITSTGASRNYPNSPNPSEDQAGYNNIIAKTIDYLIDEFDATIVFFPQLYGNSDDMPLINEIISLVDKKGAVRVFSKEWNSEIQEAVISQMDLFVGNRYHSVVFALKTGVPTVCLAYEHKAVGVMDAVKLSEFVIKVEALSYETLVAMINEVWGRRKEIGEALQVQIEAVRERARLNSILAVALINCAMRHNTCRKELKTEIDRLMLEFEQGKLTLRRD